MVSFLQLRARIIYVPEAGFCQVLEQDLALAKNPHIGSSLRRESEGLLTLQPRVVQLGHLQRRETCVRIDDWYSPCALHWDC